MKNRFKLFTHRSCRYKIQGMELMSKASQWQTSGDWVIKNDNTTKSKFYYITIYNLVFRYNNRLMLVCRWFFFSTFTQIGLSKKKQNRSMWDSKISETYTILPRIKRLKNIIFITYFCASSSSDIFWLFYT